MTARPRLRIALKGMVAVTIASIAALLLIPLPARLSQPGSPVVEFRDGSPATVFLAPDDRWRIPVRLDEVDPAYLEALLRLEDKRFRSHPGVDPIALVRAAALNLTHGRVLSGGSTLTMQLVRVLEPRPRSLVSKGIEAFRAVQLELRMSKDEILEAYLQFIPFGRNVEGVQAAALTYFGHSAADLSAAEIATLLAVPQRPAQRFPDPRNTARLRAARDRIAARLAAWDALPRGEGAARIDAARVLDQVRSTAVPDRTRPFPRLAIHAAVWLRAREPEAPRIRSTLDRSVQLLAERMLGRARNEASMRGIHNGAIVAVDHATSEVVALVGGFDFWDAAHGGQIAAFDTPRSPGSALKPVLYALAIDAGRALPEWRVLDVPETWGGYSPHNFTDRYAGLVRLEDALSHSLNVPFVHLLQDYGVERFLGALRAMGVRSIKPRPGHYGLSSIVGGIELTPLELAGLYATLARDGKWRPQRVVLPEGARTVPRSGAGQTLVPVSAFESGRSPEPPPPAGEVAAKQPEGGSRSTTLYSRADAASIAPHPAAEPGRSRPRHLPRERGRHPQTLAASGTGRSNLGQASATQVFGQGAAWLTRRALSLRDRPDFPARRQLTGAPPHIHWKTGTSFGHRDAWAAGSGPRYSAVVWLGNLDASPAADLVGADAAGPILFDLLEALARPDDTGDSPMPPNDLKPVPVCAYSGRMPTAACDQTRTALAVRRAVPTSACPYHVKIDVDAETGLALTPACRAGHRWESRSFLVWPASLRRFLRDEHRVLPEPSGYAPGCEVQGERRAPSIRSPAPGQIALLIDGLPADKQEIPLEAETSTARLSWFMDGAFLGTVAAEERLWWTPAVGRHELVVTDEAGLSSRRTLEVRMRP